MNVFVLVDAAPNDHHCFSSVHLCVTSVSSVMNPQLEFSPLPVSKVPQ